MAAIPCSHNSGVSQGEVTKTRQGLDVAEPPTQYQNFVTLCPTSLILSSPPPTSPFPRMALPSHQMLGPKPQSHLFPFTPSPPPIHQQIWHLQDLDTCQHLHCHHPGPGRHALWLGEGWEPASQPYLALLSWHPRLHRGLLVVPKIITALDSTLVPPSPASEGTVLPLDEPHQAQTFPTSTHLPVQGDSASARLPQPCR